MLKITEKYFEIIEGMRGRVRALPPYAPRSAQASRPARRPRTLPLPLSLGLRPVLRVVPAAGARPLASVDGTSSLPSQPPDGLPPDLVRHDALPDVLDLERPRIEMAVYAVLLQRHEQTS